MQILAVALSGFLVLGAADLARRQAPRTAAVDDGAGAQRAGAASATQERTATGQPSRTREWRRGPRGFATYYADLFDGRRTASGDLFDNDALVAAHPEYPFGTLVRVTNLRNGRSVTVTIVDRGPVRSARADGVIIDVSRAAAEELDFIEAGRTRVRLDIREADGESDDDGDEREKGVAEENASTSASGRRTAAAADR